MANWNAILNGTSGANVSRNGAATYGAQVGAYENAQDASNKIIGGLNDIASGKSNLAYTDKINLINSAAKQGYVQKADQLKLINAAVTQEGQRTQAAAQAKLNPIQKGMNFLGQAEHNVVNLGTGLVHGIVDPVVNTAKNFGTELSTQNQLGTMNALTKLVQQSNANARAQASAGKISQAQANATIAQNTAKLNTQAAKVRGAVSTSSHIDPTKAAGDAGQAAITIGTLGLEKVAADLLGDAAKPLVEKFGASFVNKTAQDVASSAAKGDTETAANTLASRLGIAKTAPLVSNVIKNATIGAGYGALSTASDKGSAATLKDYESGALQGAAGGAALTVGGKALSAGYGKIGQILDHRTDTNLEKAQTALQNKTGGKTEDLPTLTPEQVKSMTPQKINVQDQSSGESKLGVTTPQTTKVGVKDISNTSNVQVKTPQVMNDAQYVKQFKAISDSYDKAQAKLALIPKGIRQNFANSIDKTHQQQLEDLNNAYENPQVSDQPSKVTRVTQQTTPAPKNVTTGGTPKGYVNTTGETTTRAPKASNPTEPGKVNSTQDAVTVNKSSIGTKVNPDTNVGIKTGASPSTTEKLTGKADSTQDNPNPVINGQKISGSALKMEARAVAQGAAPVEEKASYNVESHKANAADAAEQVAKDYEGAKKTVFNPDANISQAKRQTLTEAVAREAERQGDFDTLSRLSTSDSVANEESSKAAQTLGARGYNANPHSTLSNLRDLATARKAAYKAATGKDPEVAVKETAKAIQSKVKAPSKSDWSAFIKELQC